MLRYLHCTTVRIFTSSRQNDGELTISVFFLKRNASDYPPLHNTLCVDVYSLQIIMKKLHITGRQTNKIQIISIT